MSPTPREYAFSLYERLPAVTKRSALRTCDREKIRSRLRCPAGSRVTPLVQAAHRRRAEAVGKVQGRLFNFCVQSAQFLNTQPIVEGDYQRFGDVFSARESAHIVYELVIHECCDLHTTRHTINNRIVNHFFGLWVRTAPARTQKNLNLKLVGHRQRGRP